MHKKGFGKFFVGAAIGTGLGILFAPKKGSETRKELKEKFDEMLAKVKDVDIEEVKETIEEKIEEIKKELDELDQEKVKKIANKKAEEIKIKAEELVEYAVLKGTPILEKTANSIREKAIIVTKEILDKLEK
ncbi:MAG: YtxH domain-containing protein [Bacilli bacterium]